MWEPGGLSWVAACCCCPETLSKLCMPGCIQGLTFQEAVLMLLKAVVCSGCTNTEKLYIMQFLILRGNGYTNVEMLLWPCGCVHGTVFAVQSINAVWCRQILLFCSASAQSCDSWPYQIFWGQLKIMKPLCITVIGTKGMGMCIIIVGQLHETLPWDS